MPLNLVRPNEPGSNAIRKLMENDDTCYGRAERGIYNKYELDHLYDVLGRTRRYTRELALGHTLSSYTNWTHIQTQDGMSIWRYPLTNYVHNVNNELYNDDVKLVYLASATSVSTPKSFDHVYMSNSARTATTFIDNTTEAGTASGTPFNLLSGLVTQEILSAVTYAGASNLAYTNILDGTLSVYASGYITTYIEDTDYTVDYTVGTITMLSTGSIASGDNITVTYSVGNTIYLGVSAAKFGSINIDLATTGVGNRLQFAYSSGANWQTFVPTDNTNNLATDGNINWDESLLVGWTTATVNAISGNYWIRIKPINTGIVTPTANRLIVGDAAITTLLAMSQSDFDANAYTWGYYANNIYVAVPNAGDPQNEGVTYITNGSSTDAKKNYFIYNNEYLINYINSDAEAKAVNVVTDVTLSGGASNTLINDLTYIALPASGTGIRFQIVTSNNLSSVQFYTNVATGVVASGMSCKFTMAYTTLVDGSPNTPITNTVSATFIAPTAGINAFVTLSGLAINNAHLNSGLTTVCCYVYRDTCANNLSGVLYMRNLLYDALATAGNGGIASTGGGAGEANTASNVGTGAGTLFKQKTGVDLQFKTLLSGTGVTLVNGVSTVTINAIGGTNTVSNLGAGAGLYAQTSGVNFQFRSLLSGANITLTTASNTITIAATDTGEINTAANSGTGAGKLYKSKSVAQLNFKSLASGTGITLVNGSSTVTINATAPTSGYAMLATANTFTSAQTAPSFNASSMLKLSGTSINTAGKLSNVAYKNQNNVFTGSQTFTTLNATTAYKLSGVALNILTSTQYTDATRAATGSLSGLLTAANFSTFAGKQDALGFTAVPNTRTVNGVGLSGNITISATNAAAGVSIIKGRTTANLNFKTLLSGTNVTLTQASNTITINATGGGGASGAALLTAANLFTLSQTAPTWNAKTVFKLSGTSINTAGKLSNVAYKNQNNVFTGSQTFVTLNATTGLKQSGVLLSNKYALKILTWNSQVNDYTLALTDADNGVKMVKSTAVKVIIPYSSTVAFTTNTQLLVLQYGSGQVTLSAVTGVTIRSTGAKKKTTGVYSCASLVQITANEWLLAGDIAS